MSIGLFQISKLVLCMGIKAFRGIDSLTTFNDIVFQIVNSATLPHAYLKLNVVRIIITPSQILSVKLGRAQKERPAKLIAGLNCYN